MYCIWRVSSGQQSMSNMRTAARMSPTLSQDQGCERQALDKQLAIICSEKQARVSLWPYNPTEMPLNHVLLHIIVSWSFLYDFDLLNQNPFSSRSHLVVRSLWQTQFSSSQFCHGPRLSSFRWLSCLGWHSPSISASKSKSVECQTQKFEQFCTDAKKKRWLPKMRIHVAVYAHVSDPHTKLFVLHLIKQVG